MAGRWFCWHCGRQLRYRQGGGMHYALVEDPIGNVMKVHKDCLQHVVGGGYKEHKPKPEGETQ